MFRDRLASALAMVAVATFLTPAILTAQVTFERTFGGTDKDIGYSVQQTADGGYIIAGNSQSFGAGPDDVYVVRTDSRGDTLWTRTYGGAGWDGGYSVQQSADGGYIITGYTTSYGAGAYDVYLIKTDARGDTLWTRAYGGPGEEMGWSVQQTADGGYIIAGYTSSFGAGYDDVYLIKTDASGDTLWTRTLGGAGTDGATSVQLTTDNGYIVTGWTTSFGSVDDQILLAKFDAVGNTQWVRQLGSANSWDGGSSVRQTSDGGYIIAGKASSDSTGDDVYLVKTDSAGDTVWTRRYGGEDSDGSRSIQQTPDGGFITAGFTASFGAGYCDFYLIRNDADGGTLWTKTIGGAGDEFGYSVQLTADGGYVIVGYASPRLESERDVYLIKTDSLGNVAVAEPKPSSTRASALSVTCEPNPFGGTTTIRLSPFAFGHSPVTLHVYDAQGRIVRTLTATRIPYTVWDGTDELGKPLPSGAYFVRLDAGNEQATTRVILQR